MQSSIKKLYNNFSPSPAIHALGAAMYGRYLAAALISLPSILATRQIRSVDRIIGYRAKTFYRDGRSFVYDCEFADRSTGADRFHNYAFGIAREIYIRDCYFKFLPPDALESAKIVVDIGANRGAFSCLMSATATKIVAVEAFPEIAAVAKHNLALNKCADVSVESSFVGAGGEQFDASLPQISMEELFRRYGLDQVDLLKMDIEGSEFSLFAAPEWLSRIRMLTMEVHPTCGDPSLIVRQLTGRGFQVRIADEDLNLLTDATNANFIYAWRSR